MWIVRADDHLDELDALYATLSREEHERASRLRRGRERWIVARSLLRRVLGGCLGCQPREIELRLGPNGKPELAGFDREPTPHFNLSHSGEMVTIAVAPTPVGVDVEQLRDLADLPGLARHSLGADERSALDALPVARRAEGFIAAWTRKEAYLKARGLGLAQLKSVSVNVDPDASAALLRADDDPRAAERWKLVDLTVGAGYRAALAVLGDSEVVVRRTLART